MKENPSIPEERFYKKHFLQQPYLSNAMLRQWQGWGVKCGNCSDSILRHDRFRSLVLHLESHPAGVFSAAELILSIAIFILLGTSLDPAKLSILSIQLLLLRTRSTFSQLA